MFLKFVHDGVGGCGSHVFTIGWNSHDVSILAGVYLDRFQVSWLQHPHTHFRVHTGESFLSEYQGLGLVGPGHGRRQLCLGQIVLQNGRASLSVHLPPVPFSRLSGASLSP